MRSLIHRTVVRLGLAAALALAGAAFAQQTIPDDPPGGTPSPPPAGAVVPPDPRPDDTNAQRAVSQPGNNAPFWRSVRESGRVEGVVNLPGPEMGVLVQPFVDYPGAPYTTAGEAWRQVRNQWLIPYGGALLLIVAIALALFYWGKGPIGQEHPRRGRLIERFTPFERAAHWANAIAFVVLAVSGLIMAFGKFLLLPLIGHTLFGWLSYAMKNLHNFIGPLFVVSFVIVVVVFVRDNIANAADFKWLKTAGGMLGDRQVPSHRFNAAEKGVFWWGTVIPGLVAVGSGLVLNGLIPGVGELRTDMQVASMIHSVSTVWMMVFMIGHIYMGTVGTRGAYEGMRSGYVPEGWAREHHELWYDDIKAGKIPAKRSKEPAPPVAEAAPPA
jgi:formate dehydrogenase subunit gamma